MFKMYWYNIYIFNQILEEISQHKIRIYDFPDSDKEEDRENLKKLKARVPFAVVGSTEVHEVEGKKIRGRKYPWGLVEGNYYTGW